MVLRRGAPSQGDDTYAREVDFFSGADNPILASRKYSATYRCALDLTFYPFDTQACNFMFVLTSARRERLKLEQEGEGVNYTASTQLLEYSIVEVTAMLTNHSRHSALKVTVRFRRRYGFAILTVYTPSCFFVIIAYLTTFYPLSNLQVRVVIALTAMLVLTTLLNQVSANLPRNSYFKALDIWMFGAIGLIFSILILQTMADVMQRREAEAGAAKVSPEEGTKTLLTGGLMHVRPRWCLYARPFMTAQQLMRVMQVGYPAVTLALVVAYVAYLLTSLY
ncbi:serotonin-gated chloride channel mod-1-like [Eriocheir sinensis]|uniref:serotonin-gated chloride channel mod-1-like n=1 Tax=Eriocheir sinensis TaxID=95602 RepID=UPI0021C810E8|nr:serotonin-gated chloride channel mod-1-like [Eriocheir sinensis]